MISWQDIRQEIKKEQERIEQAPGEKQESAYDIVRRRKYKNLQDITGRPLLVYATAFYHPIKTKIVELPDSMSMMSIDLSDKEGFDEIIRNVNSEEVDIFVHSPGGSVEATESIVKMLRNKFKYIRYIVTGTAKSAATMLVLSGDCILMSSSAELGPIDPQVLVRGRFCPAVSIIEQFERASEELKKDPSLLPVWLPILQEYAPSLLVECENFIKLSKELVVDWLSQHMFQKEEQGREKAEKIARFLAEEQTLSHAKRIDAKQLLELGAKIQLLEEQDLNLQKAVREVHLSIMATLDDTEAVKIFENSEGAALIRILKVQLSTPFIQPPIT